MMESHKIQACLLSISSPGLSFADADDAVNLARAINIQFTQIILDRPAQFGAFALLPLPNIEASLNEIEYSLDVLKLDGIGLYTNYEGLYLGNPKFAPIFDELHRRKAVVFVHPTTPPHSEELALGYPAPMIEYPFDTTRMVVSLLASDTLERCSNIRFIACHGGGTLPLLAPRIAPMMEAPKGGNKLSALAGVMRTERQIRSIFFDLASATHPAFIASIEKSYDPSKLMMGFDFPFMPAVAINPAKEAVENHDGFSSKDKAAIDRDTAMELCPRLADAIANTGR